eukprot:scaffold67699_cov30-Tisochrysis_lutea.AAC.2
MPQIGTALMHMLDSPPQCCSGCDAGCSCRERRPAPTLAIRRSRGSAKVQLSAPPAVDPAAPGLCQTGPRTELRQPIK